MSTKTTAKPVDTSVKSIGDHLGELRWRIAAVALVFIVLSSLAYYVREWLIHIVLSPIGHQKLVYLTPAGGFSFIFSVTIYAGILATAPVLVYHIYKFITPALPPSVRRHSLGVVFASAALMIAGVCFGYFVAIPAALVFLTNFAGGFVQPNLTADSYLNFVVAYVLGLGLMFQLPLLLVFWNWIRPFKKGELLNSQRFVLVGAFIAAAIITPTPDVLNQTMIALPIIIIYQLGVITVILMNRKQRRRERKAPIKQAIKKAEVTAPVRSKPIARPVVAAAISKPKPTVKQMDMVAKRPAPRRFSDIAQPAATQRARRPVAQPNVSQRVAPRPAVRPQTRGRAGMDFVVSTRSPKPSRPTPTLDIVYRPQGT